MATTVKATLPKLNLGAITTPHSRRHEDTNQSGNQQQAVLDAISCNLLKSLGEELNSDRAYVFHFRGGNMPNTHEWVREGVAQPFIEHLSNTKASDLPYFANQLIRGNDVVVNSVEDLPHEQANKEHREMMREDIKHLAMVPIPALGRDDSRTIAGFIGVDFCTMHAVTADGLTVSNNVVKTAQVVNRLKDIGRFLFGLQSVLELCTGISPVHFERPGATSLTLVPPTASHALVTVTDTLARLVKHPLFPSVSSSVRDILPDVTSPIPRALLMTPAQRNYNDHYKKHRFAHMQPEAYYSDGFGPEQFETFRQQMTAFAKSMAPDIQPYSRFRSVGYARYRYRNGTLHPLKYKHFFQIDPEANVLLNSKPRPFSRMGDQVRHHPVLMHMLRVLLERVWGGDLGPEAHINVHPVHVRNFDAQSIHNECHATLEGTHNDSTHRVAVVLLERTNVRQGTAFTSLYEKDTPIGLRRDLPKDEAILGPKRVRQVLLMKPFETITFDDREFMHDASDPFAANGEEKMSRIVMLIMCRVPCHEPSPVDGHPIDGYTPRSPRGGDETAATKDDVKEKKLGSHI